MDFLGYTPVLGDTEMIPAENGEWLRRADVSPFLPVFLTEADPEPHRGSAVVDRYGYVWIRSNSDDPRWSSTDNGKLDYATVMRAYGPLRLLYEAAAPKSPWKVQRLTASQDEVAELMTKVILETFPENIASTIAAKHCDPERLTQMLATRTWFEARGDTGELLGVACVHPQPDKPISTVYLGSCYVVKRRQGIGSALADARLAWAWENGYAKAETSIHEWNKASLENMRRHGLQEVGSSPDEWTGVGNLIAMQGNVTDPEST